MFQRKSPPDITVFLDVSGQLMGQYADQLPKSLVNALTSLQKKADGFEGASLADFVAHIKTRPSRKPAGTRKAAARLKLPPTSPALIAELLAELEAVEGDKEAFDALVDRMNKAQNATTMKKLAAAFTPGARPTSKPAAMHTLITGRNARRRREATAKEAHKAIS